MVGDPSPLPIQTRQPEGTHCALRSGTQVFVRAQEVFPLGAVAAEAFYDVYAAVTELSVYTAEAGPLFSVFDWDKGKELRRALVNSFLNSEVATG